MKKRANVDLRDFSCRTRWLLEEKMLPQVRHSLDWLMTYVYRMLGGTVVFTPTMVPFRQAGRDPSGLSTGGHEIATGIHNSTVDYGDPLRQRKGYRGVVTGCLILVQLSALIGTGPLRKLAQASWTRPHAQARDS
jgi:hypothetical protein